MLQCNPFGLVAQTTTNRSCNVIKPDSNGVSPPILLYIHCRREVGPKSLWCIHLCVMDRKCRTTKFVFEEIIIYIIVVIHGSKTSMCYYRIALIFCRSNFFVNRVLKNLVEIILLTNTHCSICYSKNFF